MSSTNNTTSASDAKLHTLKHGPLCGGYHVLNSSGEAATLSFCFENDFKRYGLTVGHLAETGSKLYTFSTDVARFDGTHQVVEIGSVVSKSTVTDSLVFSIRKEINVELLKLVPESGFGNQRLELPCPNTQPPRPLKSGTVVMGCGAQTCGSRGCVLSPMLDNQGTQKLTKIDDIGINDDLDDLKKPLMDEGDSGALFVDPHSGRPRFLHVLRHDRLNKFQHYGIPLAVVMAHHKELGGVLTVDVPSALPPIVPSTGLKQFPIKVGIFRGPRDDRCEQHPTFKRSRLSVFG